MKKLLCLLGAGILFVSCSKLEESDPDPLTLPVQKKVKFNIYSSKDYSSTNNDGTTALIKLEVININRTTEVETKIWDSTINERQIKIYPLATAPIVVEKVFNNIIDKDQAIKYRYVVTIKYNNGATSSNTERSEVLDTGNIAKQLGIIL
ncbi:hypothetical protein C3K47_08875 [Solitalea longa]|uniref:Uncharacterized protein n=1 Tax=Solitalea longa TaxID=2079460 RepID=A0A2S5A3J8_9SPHI|nr:hypothetical protein [Solitalea longa]POY37160.1 hypothetical protein C3K47_08875 [Solitalea longa]